MKIRILTVTFRRDRVSHFRIPNDQKNCPVTGAKRAAVKHLVLQVVRVDRNLSGDSAAHSRSLGHCGGQEGPLIRKAEADCLAEHLGDSARTSVVYERRERTPTDTRAEIVVVFQRGWIARGWYQGCGARPVKISSQARISASPAARQREEEIAADTARERGAARSAAESG